MSSTLWNSFKYVYTNRRLPVLFSYFKPESSFRVFCNQETQYEKTDQQTPRKKTVQIPKITLISDSSMSITTLEEAQKLSRRRDLKLVKIIDLDAKTQRPIYKLMTGAEYHQEELKQREARKQQKNSNFMKGEKLLFLKETINDHDIEVHCKKILKWLGKSYQVNIVINGSDSSNERLEKIYNFMEKQIGDEGRFLQKIKKGSDLKFHIIPPKREKKEKL